MKPVNYNKDTCTPISSNCVIWQRGDIPCIKLCHGDTVSDVIHALATELCTIMDQVNVSNYDLACLGITFNPPENFQILIQLLINKICEIQDISIESGSTSGCPDCVVTVASCFIQGNQTTMQLVDYVNMIAARICDILESITDLQNQITNIENRITILETTPASSFTLPTIAVDCTLQDVPFIGFGGPPTPINLVLAALINDNVYGYCALTSATGLPTDIVTAIMSQCIDSTTISLTFPDQQMSIAYPNWVDVPTTVAHAITNLWISLCDMFNTITVIQGDITTIQDDIVTIQGDITNIQGDIIALQTCCAEYIVIHTSAATTNLSQTQGHIILLVGGMGLKTVNLPTAIGNTATFTIKHLMDSPMVDTITIEASIGAQTLDGGNYTISILYQTITVISDNSDWYII